MSGGNWMPELVGMAGGINLSGEVGKHSPTLSWGDLLHADPDVIIAMPCGYDITHTRKELPVLSTRPIWSDLQAVQNRRVYSADGNQYMNRSGPRIVESVEILAEILHPEMFRFGHEGSGWVALY
jgi:iron complex transport system substrate-binding protein